LGKFFLGESFVLRKFEPEDAATTKYVMQLAEHLGLLADARPTTMKKVLRCLSDFLVAVRQSNNGLLCWPTDKNSFTDGPYGWDIAKKVQRALVPRYLRLRQKARFGEYARSAVWQADRFIAPRCLRFQRHGRGPLVEVRDAKPDFYTSNGKPKGRTLPLSRFSGAVEPLQGQMRTVVAGMAKQPLMAPDGTVWASCWRVFNDGRLDRGGRVFGHWQNRASPERLTYTIQGEPVAEVDIKAAFPWLASRLMRWNEPLQPDPYGEIGFVKRNPEKLRGLAKVLVSALLSRTEPMTRFPRGENGVSLKDEYGLPESHRVGGYVADIYRAMPFLKNAPSCAGQLMFHESEMVLQTMTELQEEGVVTYPVHDSVLCKASEVPMVVEVLQSVSITRFGATPTIEVKYSDGATQTYDGKVFSASDWGIEDDYQLVDEEDDLCLLED